MISYIGQETAVSIDKYLMGADVGYSVDQLMEVAGLGVAQAVMKYVKEVRSDHTEIAILCGPGNNGGDGLVAARYLTLFGERVFVLLPKAGKSELFSRLTNLLDQCDIEVISEINPKNISRIQDSGLILDALFGFGFKGELREPYRSLLADVFTSSRCRSKVVSVDVPSGWSVDDGPVGFAPSLNPDCVVSLTAPKECLRQYKGIHYLAGRFVPEYVNVNSAEFIQKKCFFSRVAKKYSLSLPKFPGRQGVTSFSHVLGYNRFRNGGKIIIVTVSLLYAGIGIFE